MKKLIMAFAALAFSLVASKAQPTDNFTGFYLGGHTGYGSTTGKVTSQNTHANGHAHYVHGYSNIGSHNPHVGFIGGYGFTIQSIYIGAELGYTQSNEKIRTTLGNDPSKGKYMLELKRNGYVNLGVRTGYLVNEQTMIYVRFSLNHGTWKLNDDLTSNFNDQNPANKKSNRSTFAPGIGFESSIQKMMIRFEYVYEFGKSIKGIDNSSDINYRNSFTNIGKIRTQTAKIGLVHRF